MNGDKSKNTDAIKQQEKKKQAAEYAQKMAEAQRSHQVQVEKEKAFQKTEKRQTDRDRVNAKDRETDRNSKRSTIREKSAPQKSETKENTFMEPASEQEPGSDKGGVDRSSREDSKRVLQRLSRTSAQVEDARFIQSAESGDSRFLLGDSPFNQQLKSEKVTKVDSRDHITNGLIREIQKNFEYHRVCFTCENWSFQIVNGLRTGSVNYIEDADGIPITKKCLLHYTGQEKPPDTKAEYNILRGSKNKQDMWKIIDKEFPTPVSPMLFGPSNILEANREVAKEAGKGAVDQGVVKVKEDNGVFNIKGENGNELGVVDRLTFYRAGSKPDIQKDGWYVERGTPYDESSYKFVYTPQRLKGQPDKVPLRILNGDVIYTSEGLNKSGFGVRHANFVVIKGDSLSLWGARTKNMPEIEKKGVLYLPLQRGSDATDDRRIIINVWRFNYGRNKP